VATRGPCGPVGWRFASWGAAIWLIASLPAGCVRKAPEPAAPKSTAPKSTAPKSKHERGGDPAMGTVDGAPIPLSWVKARLGQAEAELSRRDGVATALAAAAADVICLREFAVLELHAKPGEAPHDAVDRLLAGTWPADATCRAHPSDLKIAYLGQPSRWRHPTALTLWEAQLNCCDGCTNVELHHCQQRMEAAAETLHRTLAAALPPPTAATRASLAASPARERHVPAFERTLAAIRLDPRPTLMRYTAFAREEAFRKLAFRRTDVALERAALPLHIGGLTAPVRTAAGWSVAMVVGHEAPLHGGLRNKATQRALRLEVCASQAGRHRAAYRDRMLRKAALHWNHDAIARAFGDVLVPAEPKP